MFQVNLFVQEHPEHYRISYCFDIFNNFMARVRFVNWSILKTIKSKKFN